MSDLNTQFVYRPHSINPDETIADLICAIPEALPFLIKVGIHALDDPYTRDEFASSVTLRQAAETHPLNLERVLVDLERLSASSGTAADR